MLSIGLVLFFAAGIITIVLLLEISSHWSLDRMGAGQEECSTCLWSGNSKLFNSEGIY